VRDAVAEAARETLLSGTQEERDTLLESLTALDALVGSNVTVIDQLGAAENDGGANASAAVVAAALAQLEVAA
jgi:Arc/MetJ family transcription regulator